MELITDELYWFHDFDAFQNAPLGEVVLGDKELAITHSSCHDSRFSSGIMFFSKAAKNLFLEIQDECYRYRTHEEMALKFMLRKNKELMKRLLVLDVSHNFAIRKRRVAENYALVEKPIKVLHFHPFDKRPCSTEPGKRSSEVVFGNNSFGEPLVGTILKEVFRTHGLVRR